MHYSVELTVPANTAVATPATATVDLPAGIIKHSTIIFPPGCSRMVLVCIKSGTDQIMPKNSAEKYAEDAYHFEIGEFYIMDSAETLTISASSVGTNYQHKITAHFEVQSLEEMAMSRSGYY